MRADHEGPKDSREDSTGPGGSHMVNPARHGKPGAVIRSLDGAVFQAGADPPYG